MLAPLRASSSGGASTLGIPAPGTEPQAAPRAVQQRYAQAGGFPLGAVPTLSLAPPRQAGYALRQRIAENDATPAAQPAGVDEASEDIPPVTGITTPALLPAGELPELIPSAQDRFLGLASHAVDAKKERTLTADESKTLRLLLGAKTRLNPKAVPPTRDDAKLLQRMLNLALGDKLQPPLDVDAMLADSVRDALVLYRKDRGLPALPEGALLDRASLVQLGRDAQSAKATKSTRVPPASNAGRADTRSALEMLDLLQREDPVRFNDLMVALGITTPGMLSDADIDTFIAAAGDRRLVFDADTATRLRLAQPGHGAPLPWSYTAARVVASVLTGKLVPNRDQKRLPAYRSWAQRAGFAGLTPPRVLEIDALVESGYNPRLTSSAKARGLHQLMSSVTKRYGSPDPFNPTANIGVARRELARVYDDQIRRLRSIDSVYAARYPDDASMPKTDADRNDGDVWRMTWAANNAGPRRLLRYQGVPPFRETQRHVALLAWYNATLPSASEVPASDAMAASLEVKPKRRTTRTSRRRAPKSRHRTTKRKR